MELKYPHLFSPIVIRGQVIRNRIVSAPQSGGPALMEPDGKGFERFTPAAAHYYGCIARGGAGIVTTGECGVDPRYNVSTSRFNFYDDSTLPGMHMVTDSIHAFGAKAAIELSHAGQYATPGGEGVTELLGPTARTLVNTAHVEDMVRRDGVRQEAHVREMTVQDMEDVANYFARAAWMSKRAGFDILCVHAGHGWLLSQFLSPHINKRTDEYGGCAENRVRFPIQVLRRIREVVGEEMIIELRFSTNEFVEDGSTKEEIIRMAKLMEPYIDILQCSVGVRTGMHSLSITHPTFYLKEACNSYMARELKQHLSIPVDAIGAIGDPAVAEQLLAEGTCDFIAMARGHLADPDWSNKAKEGRPEDIRPCIRCLRCLSKRPRGESRCSVNPTHSWAFLEDGLVRPAASCKKVLVIGGGPSGMQAAIKAAERGHKVELYEQSGRLGGQLVHAAQVEFKDRLDMYLRWLICQVEKSENITVHLGEKATPETVSAIGADAVIVAVGASPVYPPIPGLESSIVMPAVEAIEQTDKVGKKVVILGGGSVGCEAAVHFAQTGREVTVVESEAILMAREADPHIRFHTLLYFDHEYDRQTAQFDRPVPAPGKVKVMLESRCTEISESGLQVKDKEGNIHMLEADTVVLATGMRANVAERDRFLTSCATVIPIGDCLKATNVAEASRTGYFAALQI